MTEKVHFQLPQTILSYCQGSLHNGKFVTDNSLDVINCCLDSCQPRVKYCLDSCQGKKSEQEFRNCNQFCLQLINDCESTCLEYPSEGVKIINECATDYNCGQDPIYNKNCLENNAENIMTCCHNKCITTSTEDCDTQCQQFFDHLQQGTRSSLTSLLQQYDLTYRGKSQKSWWLVVVVLGIIALFGYIWYMNR